MRTSARIILLIVFLRLACGGAVLAQDSDNAGVSFHAKARHEYQNRLAQLPGISVNSTSRTAVLTKVDLSTSHLELDGRHLYAFRFKTPAPCGDLLWAVRVEPAMTEFILVPSRGTADGPWYTFWPRRLSVDVDGVARKGDRFKLVSSAREQLERDADYIVGFVCSAPVTTEFVISVNMVYSPTDPHTVPVNMVNYLTNRDALPALTVMFPMMEVERTAGWGSRK